MDLTPAQLQTLKTDILANSATLQTAIDERDGPVLAEFYNTIASPSFIIWKNKVTQDEIQLNGFDWVRVDNLSVGKARIWEWMFENLKKSIDPSKTNIRAGIDECWKGTQADLDVRAAVYVHCKRGATRIEKLLSTGTGTTASPAVAGVYGQIDPQNMLDALDA